MSIGNDKSFKTIPKNKSVTKCTPEFIDKMCNFLRVGAYPETAAVMAGCAKETFLRWMKASHKGHKDYKPIFAECRRAAEKAMEEATTRDLMVIDRSANGQEFEYERWPEGSYYLDSYGNKIDRSGELILSDRNKPIVKKIGTTPDWNAAAWRLSRRRPQEWGNTQKVELTGANGGPIKNETTLSAEELEAKVKANLEKLGMLD